VVDGFAHLLDWNVARHRIVHQPDAGIAGFDFYTAGDEAWASRLQKASSSNCA
jgi:hypothetical protein